MELFYITVKNILICFYSDVKEVELSWHDSKLNKFLTIGRVDEHIQAFFQQML